MLTRTWRDFNYILLISVLVLLGFGVALVYSSTHTGVHIGGGEYVYGYLTRHLTNILVGSVGLVLLMMLDYRALRAVSRVFYLLSIGGLVLLMLGGVVRGGAQSWIELGTRNFQPTELAKIATIVALAHYWSHFEGRGGETKLQLGGLILAGIPLLLVLVQPDLGGAIVIAIIWLAMAWTAGMRLWQLLVVVAVAAPVAIYGWNNVLEDYQRVRLLVFLDPLKYDPKLEGPAWDITQSMNAIGSGGLVGRGWLQGAITQGGYIQAQYTDFIFSTAAEEMGFVGGLVVILFFCIFLWQGISIGAGSRDTFGRMLAVGITAMFFFHILVNIGITMRIMPVTGLPLPFVSYGGSFTLICLAAVGMLESVALYRRSTLF